MRPIVFLIPMLGLAACGGSDSSDGEASSPATDEIVDDSTDDDSTGDDGGDTGDAAPDDASGTPESASLATIFSTPTTGGLGEAIEVSPDGTLLAHHTGGLQGEVIIYDLATGSETGRLAAPISGTITWVADDQLVSWDPGPLTETGSPLQVLDPLTFEAGEPVPVSYPEGFVTCNLPFGFDFPTDRDSAALFAEGPADDGHRVCRLDVGTASVTSTVVGTSGPLPTLLIDGAGDTLVLVDGAALPGEPAEITRLASDTLAIVDTVTSPTGAARAVIGDQIVVPSDTFDRDQFLGSGASVSGGVTLGAGSYGVGSIDGVLTVFDQAGDVVGQLGNSFAVEAETDRSDTVLAIRTTDEIVVLATP